MFITFFIMNLLLFGFYSVAWYIERGNIIQAEKENKIYYPSICFLIFPVTLTLWIPNIELLGAIILFVSGVFHVNLMICIIIYFNILFLFYILTFKDQNKIIESISWTKNTYIWATIIYIISGFINPFLFIGFYIINKISVNFKLLEKFKIINNFKQSMDKIEKRKK